MPDQSEHLPTPTVDQIFAAFTKAYQDYQLEIGIPRQSLCHYSPTGKDRRCLPTLQKEYSLADIRDMSTMFFDCIRREKSYRGAPATLSCLTYHRNDLLLRVRKWAGQGMF